MKIKSISCTQFAGIRDRSISFSDGINIVYGKNESGKSTLVNLISRTLFQNARIDGRSDKEFRDLYFPGARRDSAVAGDFADGKVSFEADGREYTLSKEWGADSRCLLSAPEGVIRDQKNIDEILKDVLVYGEGVYSDMLLSSQRNADISLQTILDASKKTDAKQEISDAVSQAFAESDGISMDAIEQAINAKIEELAGKHWDSEREMPVRKAGRWATGLGEILKAYYALEDARAVLDEISRLEQEADRTAAAYADCDAAAQAAEKKYNKFNAFASRLAVVSEQRRAVTRLEAELRKISDILAKWPVLLENLERARALQAEKTGREVLDKYEAAKMIAEELSPLEEKLSGAAAPEDGEIAQVKAAQRSIATLENKLCGMNLNAAVRMLGDNSVEIKALRTGEAVEITDGKARIREAVKITVPGVMELQLSPADVDVAAIEAQLAEQKTALLAIFDKYSVKSSDELEGIAKMLSEINLRADAAKGRLALVLGSESLSELEQKAASVAEQIRPKEEIGREIVSLCGSADISGFIASKEAVVEGYAADFGSVKELKAKAYDLREELEKLSSSIAALEDIPPEYLAVSDPEAHLADLQKKLKLEQELRENALTEKTSAASRLEGYRENITGEPRAEAEKAERIFEEKKSLLQHWMHIAEVFRVQKENVNDNPMQDIADRFTHYLGAITDGRVSSEFPVADKLNMNIYSDNRLLDYSKLSEGTKETVSLAFRLAVLDHLFPDGGGVIVFDDPFTDMDAERMKRSCELLGECAKRHQVIFLTCREEYLERLCGNRIYMQA